MGNWIVQYEPLLVMLVGPMYIQMSIIYMKEQEKEEEKVVVVWWRRRRGGGSGGSRIFLGGLKGDFCFGITSEKRGMKACRLGLM